MIPFSSIYMLIKLYENEGTIRSIYTHSTFRKVKMSPGSIISSVKKLKALGLLTNEYAENGKYIKILQLTEKGYRVSKLYKQIENELKDDDIWGILGIKSR